MNRYKNHWTRHLPTIGDRVRVAWRESDGTVIGIPYGTCVDIELDNGEKCCLSGNEFANSVDDGSIVKLRGGGV